MGYHGHGKTTFLGDLLDALSPGAQVAAGMRVVGGQGQAELR